MRKRKTLSWLMGTVVGLGLAWPVTDSSVALAQSRESEIDALMARAQRRILADRAASAIPLYQQVAELDPYHPDAWYNLAEVSRALGRHADCLTYFQRLLVVFPSDEEVARPAIEECATGLGSPGVLNVAAEAGDETIEIFVDGIPFGYDEVEALLLAPGEHAVHVEAYDYVPRDEQVMIEAGETYVLDLSLEPVPHPATLRIVCDQAGASVTLEGQSLGETPLAEAISIQARAPYLVTITKEGYYDWTRRIEAGPFQELELDIVMTEYDPWAERFQ